MSNYSVDLNSEGSIIIDLETENEKLKKQLAVAVDALEEGWQLAQHYGEFGSLEKIEKALKQIEEFNK